VALADAYIAGGARILQLRAKSAPSGLFLKWSEEIVARARQAGAILIVNDRPDIARLSNADGVHLGQDDIDPMSARKLVGGNAVVGLSTHSLDQAKAAVGLPVDYVAIGPVFGTATKETGYSAVGLELVAAVRDVLREQTITIPLVAIGGITLDRAPDVIKAGASAVAVISDLVATGRPEERVREYFGLLA
jgi:thiamine-phosphate pyrophosphorylase